MPDPADPAPITLRETPTLPPASEHTPIQMAYEKIIDLFGSNEGHGIFQVEMPARLLDERIYKYTGSDSTNAQQLKPQTVAEAEFRLSDDMYDITNVVSGANGKKVSIQYQEALDSLVCSNNDLASGIEATLRNDQERIRAWLEEPVDNLDPPFEDVLESLPPDVIPSIKKPPKHTPNVTDAQKKQWDPQISKTIPRIDLYQKLNDAYNAEKLRWVEYKKEARPRDFSKQDQVDAYDRLLSTYAPVIDAKLESLWTLLVIRGQYHRVRRYVGHVDIKTGAEALLQAKQDLRSSVARNIDDTEDIYPVVLSPASWAQYLSTNFLPSDLLADPDTMRTELYTAESNRQSLISRRNALLTGKQDTSKLAAAEDNARRDWIQSRTAMHNGFSDTVIELVKIYFDAKTKASSDPIGAIKALDPSEVTDDLAGVMKDAKLPALGVDVVQKLISLQVTEMTNASALQSASEAYARALLASAEAASQPGAAYLSQLQSQIDTMTRSIESYKTILAAGPNSLSVSVTPSDSTTPVAANSLPQISAMPNLPADQTSASVWQDIMLEYYASKSAQSSLQKSSATVPSSDDSFLFWGSDNTTTTTTSQSASQNSLATTNVKVAFRAMKVEIQRPWMDAGIFTQTNDFYRASETPIAGDPGSIKKDVDSYRKVDVGTTQFPSYPTGFLVAKDVHIIFEATDDFTSDFVTDMQKFTSSGGGLLFFSLGSSGSSGSFNNTGSVARVTGKMASIVIPAPQILGWFSELTPEDKTGNNVFTALPQDEI